MSCLSQNLQTRPESLIFDEGRLLITAVLDNLATKNLLTQVNLDSIFECPEFLQRTLRTIYNTNDIDQAGLNAICARNLAERQAKEVATEIALRPLSHALRLFGEVPPGTPADLLNRDPLSVVLSYR